MFEKGKRYVFSGRKFKARQGKEEYHNAKSWIDRIRGVVIIPERDTADSQYVNGFGITDTWVTQLPSLKVITIKATQEEAIPTMQELADNESLCEHCPCTDYGDNMNARHISVHSSGCEGGWCEDAYEHYLEQREEQ